MNHTNSYVVVVGENNDNSVTVMIARRNTLHTMFTHKVYGAKASQYLELLTTDEEVEAFMKINRKGGLWAMIIG